MAFVYFGWRLSLATFRRGLAMQLGVNVVQGSGANVFAVSGLSGANSIIPRLLLPTATTCHSGEYQA